ncbi:hypothetical protein [Flindersiella endophytica]
MGAGEATDAEREDLRAVRRRPGMFGLRTYSDVISFLLGFDVATGGRVFDGFRLWLARNKTGYGENLAWPALVMIAAHPALGPKEVTELSYQGWDEHGVEVLWACVEEYLDELAGEQGPFLERRASGAFGAAFMAGLSSDERARLAKAEGLVDAVLRLREHVDALDLPYQVLWTWEWVVKELAAFEPELGARVRQQLPTIDLHVFRVRTLATWCTFELPDAAAWSDWLQERFAERSDDVVLLE